MRLICGCDLYPSIYGICLRITHSNTLIITDVREIGTLLSPDLNTGTIAAFLKDGSITPESRDCLYRIKRVGANLRHNSTIGKQEFHLDLQQNLMRAP